MSHWRIRITTVIWFVLLLGLLLSAPVVMDWSNMALVGLALTALILALPLVWLLARLLSSKKQNSFGTRWLITSMALFCILNILAAAPVYYLATVTEVRPALAPQLALSNGEKTVIFQGMMHVGSENFYKAVIYDVEKALADDYVIYYEGVQTNSPESKAFFAELTNVLTGGKDLSAGYTALSEACGLKFQSNYFTLLDADKLEHPERHVIADVDALEMKQEYQRLMRDDPGFAATHADIFKAASSAKETDDAMAAMVAWLEQGTEGQKKLSGIICRGVISMSFSPEFNSDVAGPLDALILDFRNRALVQQIASSNHPRIFITYGSKHIPGVLSLLKHADSSWKVESVKWLRVIEPPKEFDGGQAFLQ